MGVETGFVMGFVTGFGGFKKVLEAISTYQCSKRLVRRRRTGVIGAHNGLFLLWANYLGRLG
jgi:hypothetical protein